MPPNDSLFRNVLGLLLGGCLTGMVAAQVWAFRRIVAGRSLLPNAPGRPVPWGLGGVAAVVLVYVLLSGGVKVGYMALKGPSAPAVGLVDGEGAMRVEPEALSFTEVMALVSVVNALALFVVPVVLWVGSRASAEDLGLTARDFGNNVATGAIGFFLVAPWVYVVNLVAILIWSPSKHPLESMLRQGLSPSAVVLAIVSAVVLAPAAEELIFRGVLLGWLSKPKVDWESDTSSKGGEWTPVVLSSIPFAAVHASEMPAPFAIFFLSMALGRIAQKTGSLVGPFVLHASFNGFSTLMLVTSAMT